MEQYGDFQMEEEKRILDVYTLVNCLISFVIVLSEDDGIQNRYLITQGCFYSFNRRSRVECTMLVKAGWFILIPIYITTGNSVMHLGKAAFLNVLGEDSIAKKTSFIFL